MSIPFSNPSSDSPSSFGRINAMTVCYCLKSLRQQGIMDGIGSDKDEHNAARDMQRFWSGKGAIEEQ